MNVNEFFVFKTSSLVKNIFVLKNQYIEIYTLIQY
jgi:hypothetical protein